MQLETHELATLLQSSQQHTPQPLPAEMSGTQIVVLDRGFVYVGTVERSGEFLIVRNARNIRVWGTTQGLGELAGGPTPSTKLDGVGVLVAPFRAVIHCIKCTRDW